VTEGTGGIRAPIVRRLVRKAPTEPSRTSRPPTALSPKPTASGETMSSRLNPYLAFNGDARQAMEFYTSVYPLSVRVT
jgi:hypothetical protein